MANELMEKILACQECGSQIDTRIVMIKGKPHRYCRKHFPNAVRTLHCGCKFNLKTFATVEYCARKRRKYPRATATPGGSLSKGKKATPPLKNPNKSYPVAATSQY